MTVEWDYLAKGDFVYRDEAPIEIQSARGATLTDVSGKAWIDLEAANGTLLFGYDPKLTAAVSDDWAALPTAPSFVETPHRVQYAKSLGKHIESRLGLKGRLAFELGGAQGIELAIRITSCLSPTRRTIVVLDGCYHGRTLSLSNLSASHRYRRTIATSGYRIVRLPVPALLADGGSFTEKEALRFCLRFAERALTEQSFGVTNDDESDALALLFEPVLNVAGLVDPTTDYLDQLLEIARKIGCLTIADEVFCGCHRLGPFLASEMLSRPPDLVVLSKALTNGSSPLSAVWARDELAGLDSFPPGTYSTTFANTPLHFMIARRVLERIKAIRDQDVTAVTAFLNEVTQQIARYAVDEVVATVVRGMTAYVDYGSAKDKTRALQQLRAGFQNAGRETGLICASTALSKTRLMLHPPLTISEQEMDIAKHCVAASLA